MSSTLGPNWAEIISAIASLGTVLVVIVGALQVGRMNRQMHREFEMQYLQRFWTLMDRRSKGLQLRGRANSEDQVVLLAYLELSEDQITLRKNGRVTNHTWSFWAKDIREMCMSQAVRRMLEKSPIQRFPHIRQLLIDADYDPLPWGRLRKWWCGL